MDFILVLYITTPARNAPYISNLGLDTGNTIPYLPPGPPYPAGVTSRE